MLTILKKIRKKLLNPILHQQELIKIKQSIMESKIDNLLKEFIRVNSNLFELRNRINYFEKDSYDYILPIGKNCMVELILRLFNLYGEASPFGAMHNFENKFYEKYKNISGIYGFKGKMELLINNFENYFEKNDLEIIRENDFNPPEYPYMVVGNKRTGLSFYHTFPARGGDIDNYYETAKITLDERIKSLLFKLKHSKKILILFIDCNWFNVKTNTYSDNSYDKVEYIENTVIYETSEKLQEKYPEKEIYYLFLEHDSKKHIGEIEKIQLKDNIIRYRSNHTNKNYNIIWQYENNNPKEYEIVTIEKILSKFRLNDNNVFKYINK
jgi:hypothetical protein